LSWAGRLAELYDRDALLPPPSPRVLK
jgi:hypothetical protein